jgi:hypothetical protein
MPLPISNQTESNPYQNAFQQRLNALGFDTYAMLVSDILHEFSIGEGKRLIVHLFRIIEAVQRQNPALSSLLTQINER